MEQLCAAAAEAGQPTPKPRPVVVVDPTARGGHARLGRYPDEPARVVLPGAGANVDRWRWTLAHELGHVSLSHRLSLRVYAPFLLLMVLAAAIVISETIGGVVTRDPSEEGLVIGGVVALVGVVLILASNRRHEFAADDWAAAASEPVTAAIAAQLDQAEGWGNRVMIWVPGGLLLRSHPTPAARARRTLRHQHRSLPTSRAGASSTG